MEGQLLKLIYDYSKSGRVADLDFIYSIIEIVAPSRKLEDYVRDAKPAMLNRYRSKDDNYTITSMTGLLKTIDVDFVAIYQIMRVFEDYMCLFNPLEQKMFINSYVAQCVLHEIEHCEQRKICDNLDDTSVYATFCKICFSQYIYMKNGKLLSSYFNNISRNDAKRCLSSELYTRNYINSPCERMAEVNAYKTISSILSLIKSHVPNLTEFYSACAMQTMLIGYDETIKSGNCPSKQYLEAMGLVEVWKGFDFYSPRKDRLIKKVSKEFSPVERLSLGLPVTVEEYAEHSKLYILSNKGRYEEN